MQLAYSPLCMKYEQIYRVLRWEYDCACADGDSQIIESILQWMLYSYCNKHTYMFGNLSCVLHHRSYFFVLSPVQPYNNIQKDDNHYVGRAFVHGIMQVYTVTLKVITNSTPYCMHAWHSDHSAVHITTTSAIAGAQDSYWLSLINQTLYVIAHTCTQLP